MLRLGFAFLLSAVLATNALAAADSSATWPHERQGWVLGFGVGAGSAGLSIHGNLGNRETGATGSFLLGNMFTPEFALEVSANGWTRSEQGATVAFTNFTLGLGYYPGAGPVLLRAGAGFGNIDFSGQISGEALSRTEGGFSLNAAAGYEFRMLRTLAVGPLVTYNYISTTSFSTNWVDAEVALNWYFVPQ
jgi:hypothetical protein